LWRFFSYLTTSNSTEGVWLGGWNWVGSVESEDCLSAETIAIGKARLSRLSIPALSFRVDAPGLGSMLCQPYRYGPCVHIAIGLVFGIDAWQTKYPFLWSKRPFREPNRRSPTKILSIVWNAQVLLPTLPTLSQICIAHI